MNQILENMRHRTEMVLGPTALDLLARSRVLVVGVGGVGSWCAEGLVRSGVMDLTIVDSDIICATNLNRQLQATAETVGCVKVDELGRRLTSINPQAQITVINRAFGPDNWESFHLESFDYVIDAIDSLSNKILLIERVQAAQAAEGLHRPPVLFSSMGAAAKLDASRIKVDALENTSVCALARHVRRELRARGVPTRFLCVYSDEPAIEPQTPSICGTSACTCTKDRLVWNHSGGAAPDWCARKKRINGSLVHITATFGFMLSGLVLQDAVRRAQP